LPDEDPVDEALAHAAKAIGPGYAWYSTSASANPHRSGRTVWTLVYVPYHSGAAYFDIAKVSFVYQYAVLK
jgi:hypothetical protein